LRGIIFIAWDFVFAQVADDVGFSTKAADCGSAGFVTCQDLGQLEYFDLKHEEGQKLAVAAAEGTPALDQFR
jgi:hypothetical protein